LIILKKAEELSEDSLELLKSNCNSRTAITLISKDKDFKNYYF